jgi:hypothetical protein
LFPNGREIAVSNQPVSSKDELKRGMKKTNLNAGMATQVEIKFRRMANLGINHGA